MTASLTALSNGSLPPSRQVPCSDCLSQEAWDNAQQLGECAALEKASKLVMGR
jgi:hypothetical protein